MVRGQRAERFTQRAASMPKRAHGPCKNESVAP
jgi:hypothetical protein